MNDPCCCCYHAVVGFILLIVCLIALAILVNAIAMTYYLTTFLFLLFGEEARNIRCRRQCKCCIRSNPVRNDKVVPVEPSPFVMVRNPDNSLTLGKICIV